MTRGFTTFETTSGMKYALEVYDGEANYIMIMYAFILQNACHHVLSFENYDEAPHYI